MPLAPAARSLRARAGLLCACAHGHTRFSIHARTRRVRVPDVCAYLDHRPPIDVEGARARHDEVDVVLEGVEVDEEGRRVYVGEDVGADGLVSRQRAVRDFGVVVGGPDRDLVRIVLSAAAAAR